MTDNEYTQGLEDGFEARESSAYRNLTIKDAITEWWDGEPENGWGVDVPVWKRGFRAGFLGLEKPKFADEFPWNH